MTFRDYWRRLLDDNPGMVGDGKMEFSEREFCRALARAFRAGRRSGKKELWERIYGYATGSKAGER